MAHLAPITPFACIRTLNRLLLRMRLSLLPRSILRAISGRIMRDNVGIRRLPEFTAFVVFQKSKTSLENHLLASIIGNGWQNGEKSIELADRRKIELY